MVESLGGWDKLMETLRQRLEEQKGRHQGGNKWIGTAGTSPFGAYGYNPEGVRIGQKESRHRRAVKVWDKRQFRDLDGDVELGTRNIKVALKRLRRWIREGAHEELDLGGTIRGTAEKGYLDIQMRPERHNAVKVLMLFDVGGSMDDHIKVAEELFSAAKSEFKHLEYYYFHNCLYEGVWRDNRRRWTEQTPTWEVLNTYGPDYNADLRGRRLDEPLRDRLSGGRERALERRIGRGLAPPRARQVSERRLDQPGAGAALAIHPLHRDDPPDHGGTHVPHDPSPGDRGRDTGAQPVGCIRAHSRIAVRPGAVISGTWASSSHSSSRW